MKTTHKKNRPVLFLDSGIGGIPYCRHFMERNPNQTIVYLADREHFPYGKREPGEVAAIVSVLVEIIVKSFDPKIAVLACNTASLASLTHLRQRFPALPFVGTVPAVKPASLASKTGKIGVLGTELTIREPYIRELAAKNGGGEIIGIAAPELVEYAEVSYASSTIEERRAIAKKYVERFRDVGVDVIVLGCTHFLFLLEDFREEAAPGLAVFESTSGISQRIESLLAQDDGAEQKPKPAQNSEPSQNYLLLTGKETPSSLWAQWADRLGFKLLLLSEI
jgi:glutamate racemase